MPIACWITEASNTYLEYVVLIVLALQQWLHERASLLRYTYIACLVSIIWMSFSQSSSVKSLLRYDPSFYVPRPFNGIYLLFLGRPAS